MKFLVQVMVIIAVISVVSCNSQTTPAGEPKAMSPETKPITQEERNTIIADATTGLKLKRDQMEKISFYNSPEFFWVPDRINTYISLPDGMPPILRIYIRYCGDSWIFFNRVKIMSDDVIVLDKSFGVSEVHRDTLSSGVLEGVDFAASADEIIAIQKIVAAKNSIIRLAGDNYRDDHELSDREINNLKTILTVFDKLSKLGTSNKY